MNFLGISVVFLGRHLSGEGGGNPEVWISDGRVDFPGISLA